MEQLHKVNSNSINALFILAQCAVGVLSVMATICISFWGFSFAYDGKNTLAPLYFRIIALSISLLLMLLHLVFKRWASFYVIDIILHASTVGYSGLIAQICLLYDIKDFRRIQEEVCSCFNIFHSDNFYYDVIKSKELKKIFGLRGFASFHLGIWTLSLGALLLQVVFIIAFQIIGV